MIDLPPPDPAFEFVVATHGMSKGIAQTDDIQIIARGTTKIGSAEVGGQWKNLTSTSAKGEAAAFANAHRTFGKLRIVAGLTYKLQTAVRDNSDRDSFEFTGGASTTFGKIALRATAIYSPDDLGAAKQSLFIEGGPSVDFSKTVRLSANLGRRERDGAPDYTAFNLGIAKTIERQMVIDLRYYDTAQSRLGSAFKPRLVLSARVTF